jgi:hypothetical protein
MDYELEERIAIMQYEGNLTQEEAEEAARKEPNETSTKRKDSPDGVPQVSQDPT